MATNAPKPVTLTQVASVSRKIIAVGGITAIVLIVGRLFLDSAVSYWVSTHPEPPPPPTQGFGPLPKLVYPTASKNPTSYTFQVPSSRLRQPTDRMSVFFMPVQRPSLLALDRAKKQAQNLGFLLEPQQITSDIYRWSHTQPLQATLDYSIVNGTFNMKLDWQSDPTFLQTKSLPTEDDAISMTRTLLQGAGLMGDDIATGAAKITYLKSSVDGYSPTVSLSESDFLQVDIFRTPILGFEVVTDVPNQGEIRAIVTGRAEQDLRFALVDYKYLPVDYSTRETYPIISPVQAFEALKAGKGYTAAMPTTNQTDAVIRNIHLAYYDSFAQQQYLQPIYVLEGDGGYVGYVSAIPDTSHSQ